MLPIEKKKILRISWMLIGFLPQPSRRKKNAFCSLQSQGNECHRGPEVPPDASAACRRALKACILARLPGGAELPGRNWPSQLSGFFRICLRGREEWQLQREALLCVF